MARMHLRIAAALAMSACLHARAETVELRYGEDEGQTLAVHAADARGARPVVVHFGPADAALAALLAQRGYVLVDVALPAEGEAHVHAAEALAHAAATVARYGGDPARLHLVGDGAQAAATARLGADLETLTQRRVPREAIRGMVLRGGRRYPLAVGYLAPPTLLLHGRDDGEARRDAERYAARLREGGASAETMVLPDAAQRGAVQAVAWLDTAAVARVARFEQLAFEHETGLPPALASLAAWSGALHGGAGDAPRLLRKAARGASWALEHDFGARY
ncbi:MAG TPA: hypothetical protein VFO79_11865, partial [Xanthomonadales bacterium]|nr:hypothetical protein [Xanthomonadales bacterium]